MKRFCILLLAVTFAVMPLAVSVSANSPPEAELGVIVLVPIIGILSIVFLLLSLAIALGATLLLEWGVAWLFRFDKEERKVVLLTNLVSQGAKWIGMSLLFQIGGAAGTGFIGWLILLEGLICIVEFLWYRKKFIWYSQGRCLAFSLVANIASLLLGLLLTLGMLSLAGHP